MSTDKSFVFTESETQMIWTLACTQYAAMVTREQGPEACLRARFFQALREATVEFIRCKKRMQEGFRTAMIPDGVDVKFSFPTE